MNDIVNELVRMGWVREPDAHPKSGEKTGWPYLSHGEWRCLIGTLGWATIYHLRNPGDIGVMQSRRVSEPDTIYDVAKSVM